METYNFEQAYQAMLHGIDVKPLVKGFDGTRMTHCKPIDAIMLIDDHADGASVIAPMTCDLIDAQFTAVQ